MPSGEPDLIRYHPNLVRKQEEEEEEIPLQLARIQRDLNCSLCSFFSLYFWNVYIALIDSSNVYRHLVDIRHQTRNGS